MSHPLRRLAVSLLFAAAPVVRAAEPGKNDQEVPRLRAVVERLAGAECAGRATGSAGGARTVAWLVEQCDAIGLEVPPGMARVQRFEVANPEPARWVAGTRLWAPASNAADAEWRDFEPEPTATAGRAVPFALSANGVARGDVVFAGHGIRDPDHGIDDYAGLDTRGKVVLVLRGGPPAWRERRGRAAVAHMRFEAKVERALAAGAVGVLVCNRADGRSDDPGRALHAHGDGQLPAFWISRSLAEAWFGGTSGFEAAQRRLDLDAAGAAEVEEPARAGRGPLGFAVELRVRLEPRQCDFAAGNVLGWIPGTDPDSVAEVIVITAHHDHLGRGGFGSLAEPEERGAVHPGADDNASGVAAVLELARLFVAEPVRRPILVAFTDAEELGQRGSGHLLREGLGKGRAPMVVVDLARIGRATRQGLRVEGIGCVEGLAERAGRLATPTGLEVAFSERLGAASDARRFSRHGVPALLITSGAHEQLHRPGDVAGLVQWEGLASTVRWSEALVRDLAAGPPLVRER